VAMYHSINQVGFVTGGKWFVVTVSNAYTAFVTVGMRWRNWKRARD